MEIKEAIKRLKERLDGSVDTSYEWCEAIRTSISALGKQIGLRPGAYCSIEIEESGGNICVGFCPSCAEPGNSMFKYCPKCGQKIDWPGTGE